MPDFAGIFFVLGAVADPADGAVAAPPAAFIALMRKMNAFLPLRYVASDVD